MQYKKSPNPKVEELTKSIKARRVNLSNLKPLKLEDGKRLCVWCYTNKLGNHPNQKYCSKECSNQAMAWANPQQDEGVGYLLLRQNYQCNICKHDWKPFIQDHVIGKHYGTKGVEAQSWQERYVYAVIRSFKHKIDVNLRPEVDHIIPISKGGQSLGFENHQVCCFLCHKAKSKVDNSGPRKPRTEEQKIDTQNKRINTKIKKQFIEYYKIHANQGFDKMQEFWDNLTVEELTAYDEGSIWYDANRDYVREALKKKLTDSQNK